MKHKIPHLLRSRGAITRAASISRRQAVQNIVAYGASKAAVTHMTRAAAQQYGHATRVNAVARRDRGRDRTGRPPKQRDSVSDASNPK